MTKEVSDRTSRRYLEKFGILLKKIRPDYISPGTSAKHARYRCLMTALLTTVFSEVATPKVAEGGKGGGGVPPLPSSPVPSTVAMDTVTTQSMETAVSAKPKTRKVTRVKPKGTLLGELCCRVPYLIFYRSFFTSQNYV